MLLRRVTLHIKSQNWFAVFIDFLIVVVGVFIGIQVANWNENRLLNQQSIDFSKRLQADIREEAWDFQYMIEYYTDVRENAERVVLDLEGNTKLSDHALVIAAYRASQINIVTRRRATYDELVSIGKLDLIKNDLLRNTANAVYDFPLYDTIYESGYSSKYRELFRMRINSQVQLALNVNCGDKNVEPLDYQAIVNSIDYPCDLPIPETLIADAANTIRTDKAFLPFIRLRLVQLQSNVFSLEYYYPEVSNNLKSFR